MADPQQYTDAQLSDGRTLRFLGQLNPDQVRQKVTAFRHNEAAQSISANPPGIRSPLGDVDMQERNVFDDPDTVGKPSSGVAPAGKLTGLPGVSPHEPGFREAVADVSLAGTPMLAAGSPAAAIRGVVGSGAGAAIARRAADAFNAGPTTRDLVELGGGLAGGAASQIDVPNLSGKVKAVGKVAAQDAFSRIPVAGRVVRRPSIGDYWRAATVSSEPQQPEFTLPDDTYRAGFRRPRAYYGGVPPEPVPSRPGLELPGEVQPPYEGQYVDTPPSPSPTEPPFASAEEVRPQGRLKDRIAQKQLPERGTPIPLPESFPSPEPPSTPSQPVIRVNGRLVNEAAPPASTAKPERLIERVKNSEDVTPALTYPPEAPSPAIDRRGLPVPGSREDIAETKSLQAKVREAAENEDRNRFLALQRERYPWKTKFDLTNQPVKYTKNVVPRAPKGAFGEPPPGTVVPQPGEDLTNLLKKSLKQKMKQKPPGD